MFRRKLGLSLAETRALPWWERRMYLEGIDAEFNSEESREVVDASIGSLAEVGFAAEAVT